MEIWAVGRIGGGRVSEIWFWCDILGEMTDMVGRESRLVAADVPVVRGRESFESFYGREYRRVLALVHVLSGSPFLAEELTQEVFVAAYHHWDRIENPEGWVRTVAANKVQSWLRRRYAETRALTRIGPGRTTPVDPMSVETAHFWGEVRRLPRRQAQAIALFYLEDRSVTDVAVILDCSESTARVHLTRGRKALAERLGAEEET
jgi:RNA polymerase sigma-70 factor (ECF subfamily)